MAKQEVHSNQLTYEDYLVLPDDGKRHEIIEGDHSVTPAPKTKHQKVSFNLTVAIGSFVKQRDLGMVLAAPCDVILSDENVVQPDLLFVSTARASIVTEDNIRGAPDLSSKSSLRRPAKRTKLPSVSFMSALVLKSTGLWTRN